MKEYVLYHSLLDANSINDFIPIASGCNKSNLLSLLIATLRSENFACDLCHHLATESILKFLSIFRISAPAFHLLSYLYDFKKADIMEF